MDSASQRSKQRPRRPSMPTVWHPNPNPPPLPGLRDIGSAFNVSQLNLAEDWIDPSQKYTAIIVLDLKWLSLGGRANNPPTSMREDLKYPQIHLPRPPIVHQLSPDSAKVVLFVCKTQSAREYFRLVDSMHPSSLTLRLSLERPDVEYKDDVAQEPPVNSMNPSWALGRLLRSLCAHRIPTIIIEGSAACEPSAVIPYLGEFLGSPAARGLRSLVLPLAPARTLHSSEATRELDKMLDQGLEKNTSIEVLCLHIGETSGAVEDCAECRHEADEWTAAAAARTNPDVTSRQSVLARNRAHRAAVEHYARHIFCEYRAKFQAAWGHLLPPPQPSTPPQLSMETLPQSSAEQLPSAAPQSSTPAPVAEGTTTPKAPKTPKKLRRLLRSASMKFLKPSTTVVPPLPNAESANAASAHLDATTAVPEAETPRLPPTCPSCSGDADVSSLQLGTPERPPRLGDNIDISPFSPRFWMQTGLAPSSTAEYHSATPDELLDQLSSADADDGDAPPTRSPDDPTGSDMLATDSSNTSESSHGPLTPVPASDQLSTFSSTNELFTDHSDDGNTGMDFTRPVSGLGLGGEAVPWSVTVRLSRTPGAVDITRDPSLVRPKSGSEVGSLRLRDSESSAPAPRQELNNKHTSPAATEANDQQSIPATPRTPRAAKKLSTAPAASTDKLRTRMPWFTSLDNIAPPPVPPNSRATDNWAGRQDELELLAALAGEHGSAVSSFPATERLRFTTGTDDDTMGTDDEGDGEAYHSFPPTQPLRFITRVNDQSGGAAACAPSASKTNADDLDPATDSPPPVLHNNADTQTELAPHNSASTRRDFPATPGKSTRRHSPMGPAHTDTDDMEVLADVSSRSSAFGAIPPSITGALSDAMNELRISTAEPSPRVPSPDTASPRPASEEPIFDLYSRRAMVPSPRTLQMVRYLTDAQLDLLWDLATDPIAHQVEVVGCPAAPNCEFSDDKPLLPGSDWSMVGVPAGAEPSTPGPDVFHQWLAANNFVYEAGLDDARTLWKEEQTRQVGDKPAEGAKRLGKTVRKVASKVNLSAWRKSATA